MSAANYKFFENSDAVAGYIESELLATLQDDLDRMENEENVDYGACCVTSRSKRNF